MLEESAKLAQYVESHTEESGRRPEKLAVTQLLTFLGQSFSSLVDLALTTLIQVRRVTCHNILISSSDYYFCLLVAEPPRSCVPTSEHVQSTMCRQ